MRRQVFGPHAQLAREHEERRQARFGRLQTLGVDVQFAGVMTQRLRSFIELHARRLDELPCFGKRRVNALCGSNGAHQLRERFADAVVVRNRSARGLHRLQQFLAVTQTSLLKRQRAPFFGARFRRAQLLQIRFERGSLFGNRLGGALRVCERGSGLRGAAMRALHLGECTFSARKAIQQSALRCATQKRLMLMLRVQLKKRRAEFAHLGHRCRAAVNLRTTFARSINHATQHHVVRIRLGLRREPRFRGGIVAHFKLGRDVCLLGTNAHIGALSARTECEAQSVEHDGFACARFAGERTHARLKLNVEAVNQYKISDGELLEHRTKVVTG